LGDLLGLTPGLGDGFQNTATYPTAAAACAAQIELCTAAVITISVIVYAPQIIDTIKQMSKGSTQEVGHDYVRDMARGMPGDYCQNLKDIMQKAKRDGNSKLFNDAKATWKQDCRGR
jgi:hypothetical protein